MPYRIKKIGDKEKPFCVVSDSGKNHGCHESEAKAKKQLAAMYVNAPPAAEHSAGGEERTDAATFSGDLAETVGEDEDSGIVYRAGTVFVAGDYPEVAFSMTPEEIDQYASEFSAPVPVDLEHTPTILDGKLGNLEALAAKDGKLAGVVGLPKWLNDVIGPDPVKVSGAFNRQTKRLEKLSLVIEPRVEEAALMAAFARHDTNSGQSALQYIHDEAARSGAVCKKPAGAAKMHSSHESNALQTIHDHAVEHGAKCAAKGEGTMDFLPRYFSGKGGGAGTTGKGEDMDEREQASFFDHVRAFFSGNRSKPEGGTGTGAGGANDDPRIATMAAQIAEERQKRIDGEAVNFAATLLKDEKILPYEAPTVIAQYRRAAYDDADKPETVTFAKDKDGKDLTGSRVDTVRFAYESRQPMSFLREISPEQLPKEGKELAALFNQTTTPDPSAPKPLTPERRAELLKMGDGTGAALLREESARNGGNR